MQRQLFADGEYCIPNDPTEPITSCYRKQTWSYSEHTGRVEIDIRIWAYSTIANWLPDWFPGWPTDLASDRFPNWMIRWLTDWLTDRLSAPTIIVTNNYGERYGHEFANLTELMKHQLGRTSQEIVDAAKRKPLKKGDWFWHWLSNSRCLTDWLIILLVSI